MRWLLVASLLLAASVLPAGAAYKLTYRFWCPVDGWQAVFVVNRIGSASVLHVKGQKPNHWPRQEQVIEPVSDDPLDLRGRDAWIVEGHRFRLCPDQMLPPKWATWVKIIYLPSEVGIPSATSP